ncbi:MAG: SPFH domain-containing protein [Thermoleophilaceae bacterium]
MSSPSAAERRPRHESPRARPPRVASRPRLRAPKRDSDRPRGAPPAWFLRLVEKKRAKRIITFLAGLLLVVAIVGVSGARFARQDVGHVGVVRNGGPFDSRKVRQILAPGQGLTWTGWYSQKPHSYPASHVTRLYTVTSDPKRGSRSGVDVITVPTKDGVQVGLEASVFLRFVGESDVKTLTRFDVSVGTRRFSTADGRELYPYQGDDGFNAMLDTIFRPVLENDLRAEIGRFRCAEIVASCAQVRGPVASRLRQPSANVPRIQSWLATSLQRDLTTTLGQRYFWDIRVRLARIKLPGNVQTAVDKSQAQYASVNAARAEYKQARYQNARNQLLARTYNSSPALANIETMKALPPHTTLILGPGGKTPNLLLGAGGTVGTGLTPPPGK